MHALPCLVGNPVNRNYYIISIMNDRYHMSHVFCIISLHHDSTHGRLYSFIAPWISFLT